MGNERECEETRKVGKVERSKRGEGEGRRERRERGENRSENVQETVSIDIKNLGEAENWM